jgi:DNA-binding transcriptional LysR family regulator
MIDLVHLKSFAEVAERGTVAAAASAQGYTAPAVSQHVAKLEDLLGVKLFDRVRGRLVLTSTGKALLPIAFEMLDLEARATIAVGQADDLPHVVVSGFATAISTVLVPRLRELRTKTTIEIIEAEDSEALRALGLGEVDIALTQDYEGVPEVRSSRFTFTPLVHDRLILVLPPDWTPSVTIDRLRNAPWLLNGKATRCALATEAILSAAGITPTIVGTVADNAALLALVAAGQGVTVMPSRALRHGDHHVTVADQDLGVVRTIYAVTRSAVSASMSPILDVLGDAR